MRKIQIVDITNRFAQKVVAFAVAGYSAMGNRSCILFITKDQITHELYIVSEDDLRIVNQAFCDAYHGMENDLPKGWKHIPMGAGNSLYMIEWLETEFFKQFAQPVFEDELNAKWLDVIKHILQQTSTQTCYEKVRDVIRTDFDIVPFDAERKELSDDHSIRETLSVQWESDSNRKEKVVAIGINPSTARDGKSDVTMTKLCRFLDMYGFNNVTMLNLYETVSPDQRKIREATKTDFTQKRAILEEANIILLVWGIDKHVKAKREAMKELSLYADKLYCIKNPEGSFPAHPSRMPYDSHLIAWEAIESCSVHE